MTKHVLFIHGAGQDAYEADEKLVASLQRELGHGYNVRYPAMPGENPQYEAWKAIIAQELAALSGEISLVGHSLGGSVLLKYLAEEQVATPVAGVFLLAVPFWNGDDEDWHYDGFALREGFAANLSTFPRIFLFHSRDDDTVPFAHLAMYAARLPWATMRALDNRGHQFSNDLSEVAETIKGGHSGMLAQRILDFYTQPAAMTSAGRCAPMFSALPRDIAALTQVVQGQLLHEHLAAPAYDITLSNEHRAETHTRATAQMLDRLAAHDGNLSSALPVGERMVGTCRNFSVLLVAMLRSQGIPARARCGFGAYFVPGRFVDHWVAEYWHPQEARWIRVDAQLDAVQRELFGIDFDVLDVPHDRFLIAGDAWAQCRAGRADPATFCMLDMSGLWFIAGNLMRDFAALNNMEMLPWDVWGAMPAPDEQLNDEQLAFFDRLAALTRASDEAFDELRALYDSDKGIHVPETVFNAVLNRAEAL